MVLNCARVTSLPSICTVSEANCSPVFASPAWLINESASNLLAIIVPLALIPPCCVAEPDPNNQTWFDPEYIFTAPAIWCSVLSLLAEICPGILTAVPNPIAPVWALGSSAVVVDPNFISAKPKPFYLIVNGSPPGVLYNNFPAVLSKITVSSSVGW